jgi:peroxiredoxin Q/BCP
VLGVSRDTLASHRKFREKYDIPFSLLSDPSGKVCEAYGVLKEKKLYGKKHIGIDRSTFIIDEKGLVWKIYRGVKVDGHAEDVLGALSA